VPRTKVQTRRIESLYRPRREVQILFLKQVFVDRPLSKTQSPFLRALQTVIFAEILEHRD